MGFFDLSKKESDTLKAIVQLSEENSPSSHKRILNLIISLGDGDSYPRLVAHSQHGSLILGYLKDKALQERLFKPLLNKSFNATSDFLVTEHPTLSFAELYLGHRYYQLAQEANGPNTFMPRALLYGSFHAAFYELAKCGEELKQIKDPKKILENMEHAYGIAMQSIKIHGTPSLINFAVYFNHVILAAQRLGLKDLKDSAKALVVQALSEAEKVAELSSGSIHNAYFGQGVTSSNEQGLDSLSKVMDYLGLQEHSSAMPTDLLSKLFIANLTSDRRQKKPNRSDLNRTPSPDFSM